MKTKFWMLGVAVAALTSCTNDEVVEVNESNAIKFESFVNKGTRAVTDVTTSDLTKFYVFGNHSNNTTADFENVAVSKSGSDWTYTGDKYWTKDNYYFGAYATKNESEQLSTTTAVSFSTTGKLTFTNYTINNGNDLVAALASRDNTSSIDASKVSLTFKHMLAKIKFTFTNKHTMNGVTMDISDFMISEMQKTGTCEYKNETNGPSWNLSTTETASTTSLKTGYDIAVDATYSDDCLVIPQTIGEITVSFKVTYKSGTEVVGEQSYTDIKLSTTAVAEWKNGFVYNYTAELPLSPNKIEFTVNEVTVWDETTTIPDGNTGTDIDFSNQGNN